MNNKKFVILSFLAGFSSIIAQTVIMRSFQTVFYGNELSYAMLLFSWLLWVAVGSLLTTLILTQARLSKNMLIGSFAVLALAIPGVVFGARYIKSILDVDAGQMIGFGPMILSGFVLTAPVGFFVGTIFVVLCYSAQNGRDMTGQVYFWESLGSGIGGVFFSFFLLKIFSMTMIAWLAAAAISIILLIIYWQERSMRLMLAGFFVFVMIFIGVDIGYHLDYRSQQKQFPFAELITAQDSPYANIAVVKHDEDYSVYQNGMLSFTANDLLTAEENVHFALLAHPNPRRVLLIGNGLGGEIAEILKYPHVHLDFVELDSALIQIAQKYLPKNLRTVLDDPRVMIYEEDARHFVKTTRNRYDVVIVNVGDPYTAGLNRYYTLEFQEELDRILDIGGIASFRVSSSENFLSEENRIFLRSLYWTMKKVFPGVRSIPGDTHTFLVSNTDLGINIDSQWMVSHLRKAGVHNRFLSEYTLPFRVTDERVDAVEKILDEKEGLLNTDLFPRSYLFQTILWSTHFNTGLKRLVEHTAFPLWLILLVAMVLVSGVLFWKTRRDKTACMDLAIATTGFSEIIFEIVVILAFQSLYGTAYDKIALILASFMFGLVLGSRWAIKFKAKRSRTELIVIFSRIQLGIVIYPLLMPLLFILFRDAVFIQQWAGIFALVFACFPFIAGFLGGLQYPVATRVRSETSGPGKSYAGGFLYGIDVFGASIGALVTGAFLIPLYGIVAVCVLCTAVNVVVYFFCLGAQKS